MKAAGKGAIWGLNNGYRTANELLGTIKGGIIDTFGGANIVDPLGGALGSYIGDRILEAYTGPSKSIPGVGLIPYLGSFFGTYQEAGGDLTPEELAEIKRKSGNQSTARTNISAQANSSVTLIASSLAKTSSAVSYASSTNSSQTSKLAPVATPANTLTASGGTGGGQRLQ